MSAKLVVGNWKMNGSFESNRSLIQSIAKDPVASGGVVCPPLVFLSQVKELLQGSDIVLGAQNLSRFDHGAYTGEVSASMLQECGVGYVLVGHSERRALFGESDAEVAAKVDAALAKNLVPVVCVGETLLQRQQGLADSVVLTQLRAVLDVVGAGKFARCLIAYEPVWAIGTGVAATVTDVRAMHACIKRSLSEWSVAAVPVLYGGSVKPDNAAELMALSDVDGALVGGASLVAEQFLAICRAAKRIG